MGEVVSYTKVAIDELFKDVELTGTDLVFTKMDDTTFTVDLSGVSSVDQADIDLSIATAVADLVNSAPGTLNQLNELATAIGNDPNFATTLATSLAGKATLTAGKVPVGEIPLITSAMITDGTIAVGDLAFDPATQAELDAVVAALSVIASNNQTADYGLVLADAGKVVELNKATAITLTVPLNATQAFPIGTVIEIWQQGAGQVTVAATGGVTIRSSEGKLKLYGQYAGASLRKRGTDEWVLIGDLVA